MSRDTTKIYRLVKLSHDQRNLQAAQIILTDPTKHGGEQSALVKWAALFMQRHGLQPGSRSGLNLFGEVRR